MGDKAGAIKIIVGVMTLYAFIAFGISVIYEDSDQGALIKSQDVIAGWTMAEPEDVSIVSNDALFGVGAFVNGLYGIGKAILGGVSLMVRIASFSDPRIPYLIYVFIILPSNLALVLASVTLFLP